MSVQCEHCGADIGKSGFTAFGEATVRLDGYVNQLGTPVLIRKSAKLYTDDGIDVRITSLRCDACDKEIDWSDGVMLTYDLRRSPVCNR